MDHDRESYNAYVMEHYDKLHYFSSRDGSFRVITIPTDVNKNSRGPFVRVSGVTPQLREAAGDFTDGLSGWEIIWVGQGVRLAFAINTAGGYFPSLSTSDWITHARAQKVHEDMGDLGVRREAAKPGRPVFLGTDGGLFKPTSGLIERWGSGALPGSKLNSWQISDMNGTNKGSQTNIYFATQDNSVFGSTDGGRTFQEIDCFEGFHVEGPYQADASVETRMAYGRAGCGSSNRFIQDDLTGQKDVPIALTGSGNIPSDVAQAF